MTENTVRMMTCRCGRIAPNPTGRRKLCPLCAKAKKYPGRLRRDEGARTERIAGVLAKVMAVLDKVPDLQIRHLAILCAESEIYDQRATDGVREHVMEEEAISVERESQQEKEQCRS